MRFRIARLLIRRRLVAVGQSLGRQTLRMIENANRVNAMIDVCAQSGYLGVQGGSEREKVQLIVTLIIPLLSRMVGYFPRSWFANGTDLPVHDRLKRGFGGII